MIQILITGIKFYLTYESKILSNNISLIYNNNYARILILFMLMIIPTSLWNNNNNYARILVLFINTH